MQPPLRREIKNALSLELFLLWQESVLEKNCNGRQQSKKGMMMSLCVSVCVCALKIV